MTTERGAIRFGSRLLTYTVLRSTRRKKTVTISIDPQDGILVAAPLDAPKDRVEEIVRKRCRWIVRQGVRQPLRAGPKQFVSGESLPYLGRQVRLEVMSTEQPQAVLEFSHWTFRLKMPKTASQTDRYTLARNTVISWYKRQAERRVNERVRRMSKALGMEPPPVRITNQQRRWGSCGSDGVLRLNWRTVLLEPSLMDYVAAHELAHLAVRNHSLRFWAELAKALPDYRARRNRLKEAGAGLPF